MELMTSGVMKTVTKKEERTGIEPEFPSLLKAQRALSNALRKDATKNQAYIELLDNDTIAHIRAIVSKNPKVRAAIERTVGFCRDTHALEDIVQSALMYIIALMRDGQFIDHKPYRAVSLAISSALADHYRSL